MELKGDHLERGVVVAGYRIDEMISRGGMGVVYRATNVALHRIYALKVIAPELAQDDEFRQRFMREMRTAASLHHPNIVGIHYAGDNDGLLFFVMDYVNGTDLKDVLVKHGAIDPTRAVDLLDRLASALDAAHGRGLVHRDVKPANILISVQDGEEHAYLTDFGLAKKADTVTGLTAKGTMVGTVDYMAPEQVTGAHTDARTDIYALGCVFYQMLTGEVPYDRDNSVATLYAHVHEPPPKLEGELRQRYPGFALVLEKAMAKDPAERYLSAGDFARDAAAVLRGTRYTAAPTIVGTGEATPLAGPHRTTEDAQPDEVISPVHPDEEAAPAQLTEVAPPAATAPPSPPAATAPPSPAEVPAPAQQPTQSPNEPNEALAGGSPSTRIRSRGPEVPAPPAADADGGGRGENGAASPRNRYRLPGLAALVVIIGAIVAVIVVTSGNSSKPSGSAATSTSTTSTSASSTATGPPKPAAQPFASTEAAVPTNRVTGNGKATVQLVGDVATVSVDTQGLFAGAHLLHIHAGARGICPPASAAHLHNGHLSISTGDGLPFYGAVVESLTTHGDTSGRSLLAFPRYPSVSDIRYTRRIKVPRGVAGAIRAGSAVVIVHGIDYNRNGVYDNGLDRSDLDPAFPGEETAPALCGTLRAAKTASGAQTTGAVFRATMHRSLVAAVPAAPDGGGFVLLCHLLGINPTGAAARRLRGATTAT
jgi:serine/threonine protein kinase